MRHTPWIRPYLPWIVGTLLLGILFWRVPVRELIDAMAAAQVGKFAGLLTGACGAWFLIDSAAFAYLFSRFNTPLSSSQARELRGLTYLLTPIHWNLGRAAVIARLHSTHRVPLLEATSSMALYQTLDAILLSGLAWIGMSWIPAESPIHVLTPFVGGFFIGLTVYLFAMRTPYPWLRFADRLRTSRFHRSHRLANPRELLALLAFRCAYYGVFLGVYVWGASAFGIDLPFSLVLVAVPIIQGIGALPISPAGLGTQQAAMLYLFSGYGEAAAIMAFGLSFPLLCIVLRSLIGWFYLHRLARPELLHGQNPEPSATAH